MKKLLLSFVLLLALFSPQFSPALAAPGDFVEDLERQTQAAAGQSGADLGTPQDPRLVVTRIIRIFLSTIGILLVSYIIYGGALIFLSGGSEDKVNEGKAVIRRAILGLIVIMFSYSITIFVSRMVQGDSGPCGSEDINCIKVEEDRAKYRGNYDESPFAPKAEISPELKGLFD